MKKFVKAICVLCAVILCTAALFSCGKEDKIVIGMSGPLTGGAAMYGVGVQRAAQMAIDEINAAGGLDGVEFKLNAYDDQNDPTRVSSGYANLFEGGMKISIGTVTTKPGLEFSRLSKEDNVFFITPSASGDKVPEFANGFQMCFADSNQGTAAAGVVNSDYADKKVGVIYNSADPYSTGILEKFEEALSPAIKENLKKASFDSDKVTDLSSQINVLKDCEFIFMPIYYTPASLFMKQALAVENSIEVYYGCDGLDGIDAIKGFDLSTIPQEVSMLTHFNSAATEGPAKAFVDKYKAKYGETPSQFAASAYDCVYAIFQALQNAKKAGKTVSAETTAAEFCTMLQEQFKTMTFTGVTGEYRDGKQSEMTWDENGYVTKTATKAVVKESTK